LGLDKIINYYIILLLSKEKEDRMLTERMIEEDMAAREPGTPENSASLLCETSGEFPTENWCP